MGGAYSARLLSHQSLDLIEHVQHKITVELRSLAKSNKNSFLLKEVIQNLDHFELCMNNNYITDLSLILWPLMTIIVLMLTSLD